jgi:error-prone DNA polymerase
VLFHAPDRRILQDVVTCIRHNCTIDAAGFARAPRRPLSEAARRNAPPVQALSGARWRTSKIAERCRFSLDELAYQYPDEVCIPGMTPQQALEKLTWEGAASAIPRACPTRRRDPAPRTGLIEKLGYAPYFLTVNSIVRFARSKDILCQGRGSAANSAVCYVLGITSIDPERNDLLFERFVSEERASRPTSTSISSTSGARSSCSGFRHLWPRPRRAVLHRDPLSRQGRAPRCRQGAGPARRPDQDAVLPVWGWSEEGVEPKHAEELNLNLGDRRLRLTLDLARQLMGAPRHLSQHPGGFVLTRDRLDELVPIEPAAMEDRQVIEWDKDDIDALKFMKVDVPGARHADLHEARPSTCCASTKGIDLDLATIPAEDPRTYAMIRKADTLGTSRSKAARRCRCCRGSSRAPSTTW